MAGSKSHLLTLILTLDRIKKPAGNSGRLFSFGLIFCSEVTYRAGIKCRFVPQKLFGVRSVHHVPQFLPEFRSIGTSVIFVIPCLANDLSSSK